MLFPLYAQQSPVSTGQQQKTARPDTYPSARKAPRKPTPGANQAESNRHNALTVIEVIRPPDTLFLRPSILSKWSGLRGLEELEALRRAEQQQPAAHAIEARAGNPGEVRDRAAATLDHAHEFRRRTPGFPREGPEEQQGGTSRAG